MRTDLLKRYRWYELVDGKLVDPEIGTEPTELMLFSYNSKPLAYAALAQYIDKHGWGGKDFHLQEVVGLI